MAKGKGKTDERGERAFREALRALRQKPLTEAELLRRLEKLGLEESAVTRSLDRLRSAGYLDDDALAVHFILSRAERLGHGRRRLLEELQRRGIPSPRAVQAWNAARERGLDPAAILEREIERRTGSGARSLDGAGYRRVYNALARAGFDEAELTAALEPYRNFDEDSDHHFTHGTDDEFS